MKNEEVKLHYCELDGGHGGYGEAVDEINEDENGTLWGSNGEYSSQFNYCPKCGYKAKEQF